MSASDLPAGDAVDNDYVSRTGQKEHIPVQSDEASIEDPIDSATADSDQVLGTPPSFNILFPMLVLTNSCRTRREGGHGPV